MSKCNQMQKVSSDGSLTINHRLIAPPERCRNAGGKKDPRVFFICTKGGRGGAEPDPHTCRSRNPPLEDPPQFFGQIFWGKILEIKIAGQRSWHRWSTSSSQPTPQRLLPRPPASLRIYILHAGRPGMPRL